MLLSLVGVAGVVSNQWHCQLADNKQKLVTFLSGEFSFYKDLHGCIKGISIPAKNYFTRE